MITQGRLAHHHRPTGYHDTVNELPLDRTYLPLDWQEPQVGQGRLLAGIGAAAFVCLLIFMGLMANRSPLYAAENPTEVQNVAR